MSLQGPIIVVADDKQPRLTAALDAAKMFPLIETGWDEAPRAVAKLNPALVVMAMREGAISDLEGLAKQAGAIEPYLPLVAIDPRHPLPPNVIPFSQDLSRLAPRVSAALRVRTLHTTVLRRLHDHAAPSPPVPHIDPLRDTTVLLIGRASAYAALSVALGERAGLVGALSIEAAAKHLNTRDIDGVVIGEGFSDRVVDAFLTVLSEDSRFRNLPVVAALAGLVPAYDLANLEVIAAEPELVAANTLPMVRQHAFEAALSRTLRSLDAGGLLDPQTGLLTREAFDRDLSNAIRQTLANGGGLSVARFAFDRCHERARTDGGRLISRLMRQMDFGAAQADGSVVVVFAETDLRTAHAIARRLCSVMRHTSHGKNATRTEPAVTFATLQASDTAHSLLARLDDGRRAAS
jgi:hypothetical protein